MRLRSLGQCSGFLFCAFLISCGGGGGNTPPVTPLNVTTASTLPQGLTGTAYSETLAATGGTAPYTWTVTAGNLPAGITMSTGGVISGTPTAAGTSNFTVQIVDSESTPQKTTAPFTLAISGGATITITSSLPVGTVGVAYSSQLTASGGIPPYSWSLVSATLPPGLTLSSAGLVSGTPTAAGSFDPVIEATDSTTTNKGQMNLPVTINPAGTPLPDGSYAFQFDGNAPNGNPVGINGVFEILNGAPAVGFYDENILNQAPLTNQLISGGAVSVSSTGLGQLELTLQSGNITFALAVPLSSKTAGSDSDIRIIEFDDTTGTGMRGSGVLKNSNASGSLAKGGYAFGFSGFDTHSQPTALAGSFQADGAGNISAGEVDMNDNGTVSSFSAVTGTYTVSTVGRGVITLNLASGNTVTYTFYQVSPTEMLATSGNLASPTIPLVSGSVLQQSGSFSNASLTGVNVLELRGEALGGPASYIPDVTLGLVTSDGNGNITTTYDEFKSTLLSPQSYSGTYVVNVATGRVAVAASGTPPIFYLASSGKAFVLGTDTSVSSGLLEAQSGSPFTNASFKGNYLGGTLPIPEINVVSLVAADGNGNVQYTYNSSGPKGLESNQSLSGTYSVGTTGRTVVTVTGDSNPRIFYVVSPVKTAYLSGENGGYLGSFEQ